MTIKLKERYLKVAFIIGARGSAYDINVKGIRKHLSTLGHTVDTISNHELPACMQSELEDYDIIFSMMWWDNTVSTRISGLSKPKKCAIVGSHVHIRKGYGELLKNYSYVFCVSNRLKKELSDTLGCNAVVLRYFYDEDIFYPALELPEEFTIGWSGNTDRAVKRYHIFKEFAAKTKYPCKVATLLPQKEEDADNLIIVPDFSYEEMGDFYRSLSCYIVTSESEGQPKTGIEAALCGVLVVGSDVGILPELNAITIPEPLTVEYLRILVESLAKSSDALYQAREIIRDLAYSKFKTEEVLSIWKKILKGVMK